DENKGTGKMLADHNNPEFLTKVLLFISLSFLN
ncbi:MAG: hypothetical protein ACJAUQ_001232, partial [Maribacter sp.]